MFKSKHAPFSYKSIPLEDKAIVMDMIVHSRSGIQVLLSQDVQQTGPTIVEARPPT